jgi:hypothetical protein
MEIIIAQALAFIAYVLYCNIKAGRMLPSISYTWYFLKPYKKNHWFTIFCTAVGGPMWIHAREPFADWSQICFVGCGLFLFAVSMAPNFSDKIRKITIMHFTFAAISIVLGAVGVCITTPALWLPFACTGALCLGIGFTGLSWKISLIEYIAFVFIVVGVMMGYHG